MSVIIKLTLVVMVIVHDHHTFIPFTKIAVTPFCCKFKQIYIKNHFVALNSHERKNAEVKLKVLYMCLITTKPYIKIHFHKIRSAHKGFH